MRFLSLLATFAVFITIAYFSIYFWGLGRTLHRFDNPFSQVQLPMVLLSWDQDELWKSCEQSHPDCLQKSVVWIDAYRDSSGELRALPSSERPEAQNLLATNLKSAGPDLLAVVKKWKDLPLVFSIHSNEENIDIQFNQLLKDEKLTKVLIQSEFDNVMSAIKIQQPLWAYGVSASDRVRWMTLSSLGLAPAATLSGDIFISPLKTRSIDSLTNDIVNEAHRRHIWVVAGPLSTKAEVLKATELGVDGFFVTSIEALEALPSIQK